MTENAAHPDSFSRLLQDLVALSGHALDEEMLGLEFEHEDWQATVLPHQLNGRARREHD